MQSGASLLIYHSSARSGGGRTDMSARNQNVNRGRMGLLPPGDLPSRLWRSVSKRSHDYDPSGLLMVLTWPDKKAEAIPYFERLLAEFEQSEFRADAQKRLEELKAQ